MSSTGQKVTSDPESRQNPKNENPGIVTSDSLAGESITSGGSFGANSDARGPMAQPSHSTTTNTTDTSGATTLPPAQSSGVREMQQGSDLDSMKVNEGSGVGPTYNTAAGGAGGGSENTNPSSGSGYSSGGQGGQGGEAPGYTSHPAPSMGDNFAPKGKNLTEGGFDSDAPNASFTSEIGSKDDPGRAALNKMEISSAPVAGGEGPREMGGVSGDGQYDALGESSA